MNDNPFISVVIPTYNSEKHILKTTKVFLKYLRSLPYSFELIYINDASIDNTFETLKFIQKENKEVNSYNVKKNIGQLNCINLGLKISKGRYVISADDDLQYKTSDISLLLDKIQVNGMLVVNGKSNDASENLIYMMFKSIVFPLFLSVFFFRYSKKGFFSSLKIFDKKQLDEFKIVNVFHFWEIPLSKISYCEIVKAKGVRGGSSYSLSSRIKVFRHILIKFFLEFFKIFTVIFLLLFFFTINFNFFIISLFSVVLILFLSFKLKQDKIRYLSIAREEKAILK